MSDATWFIAEEGEQRGPFRREDVAAFVAAGRVKRNTLVWNPSLADWTPATNAGLFEAYAPGDERRVFNRPDAPLALPGARPGEAFRRYVANALVFEGRASRAEYWWATLIVAAIGVGAGFADFILANFGMFGVTSGIFALLTIVPTFSVSVRRLHDSGSSGWWLLGFFVPFVNFYVLFLVLFQRGSVGANKYGGVA